MDYDEMWEELRIRINTAINELKDIASDYSRDGNDIEKKRVEGKIEGVRLVREYMMDILRSSL